MHQVQLADGTILDVASEADAVELGNLYQRRGMMPNTEPAQTEWERRLRQLLANAERLAAEAQNLRILAESNDLNALITATPDGEYLPKTTIRKEDALDRMSLLDDLVAWLGGYLADRREQPEHQRIRVIYRRF